MEILDLYDNDARPLNKTIERGKNQDLLPGENVMVSIIYIKNKDGKFLIQKTTPAHGGDYTSTGGHVAHGETGLTTIVRELKEELNILKEKEDVSYIATFKHPEKVLIVNAYFIEVSDEDINNIKIQPEEVESIIWLTKEEIEKLIQSGEFSSTHGYVYNNYIKNRY